MGETGEKNGLSHDGEGVSEGKGGIGGGEPKLAPVLDDEIDGPVHADPDGDV